LWQPVVVHHYGGNARLIFPQVIHNVLSHSAPRLDSTTPVALTGVSDQACANRQETTAIEMWREQLADEVLLGFTFHMNEQSGHCDNSRF
jgi:hypothetical protein